ncbi:MAG: hypothetical protein ACO3EE_06055 [Flavobacteriales bacterium]
MIEKLPRYVLIFVLLILAQVLVFNRVNVSGFLNTFPYVLFLLILPSDTNRALLLVVAFIGGISVDIFSDSGGVHAAACVPLAYMRHFMLSTTTSLESKNDSFEPNIYYFDFRRYLTYAGVLILVHHSIVFFIEVFEFSHLFSTILKIIGSTLLTLTFVVLIQYIFLKKKEQ